MRCTDTSLVLGLFFRWDKPNPRQGLAPAPTPNPESSQSRGEPGAVSYQCSLPRFFHPCSPFSPALNVRSGHPVSVWKYMLQSALSHRDPGAGTSWKNENGKNLTHPF